MYGDAEDNTPVGNGKNYIDPDSVNTKIKYSTAVTGQQEPLCVFKFFHKTPKRLTLLGTHV